MAFTLLNLSPRTLRLISYFPSFYFNCLANYSKKAYLAKKGEGKLNASDATK
jgi:hypothetical protein